MEEKKRNNYVLIIASIIGFVADIITIASVTLSKKDDKGITYIFSNIEISNWHMTFLWIIAFITYLGILQIYWENNKLSKDYSETFSMFLSDDLILKFKLPFLIIPFILLFALLAIIWGIYVVPILFIISVIVGMFLKKEIRIQNIHNEMEFINNKWSQLKKRITLEMARYQWIDTKTLNDWGDINSISHSGLLYALKKYADENLDLTQFGNIYEDRRLINYNVLISREHLNKKYSVRQWS